MDDAQEADGRAASLRRAFLGWQCRVRQHAVRRGDGRPTRGTRPRARLPDGSVSEPFTTVMLRADAAEFTTRFRHIHRTVQAPSERYEAVMRILQGSYYQLPEAFSDALTALFGANSSVAASLFSAAYCHLEFEQFGQSWTYRCTVHELAGTDAAREGTYWHNALFNPRLGEDIRVLAFEPDWNDARAHPPVPG